MAKNTNVADARFVCVCCCCYCSCCCCCCCLYKGRFPQFPVWEMLTVDHGIGQFFMTALIHMVSELRATKSFYKTAMCRVGKCKLGAHCRHVHTEDALQKTWMEPPTYQQTGSASFNQQAHRQSDLDLDPEVSNSWGRMQTSPASADSTSNCRSPASPKTRKTSHLASMSMDFDRHHPASMCIDSNQHAQSISVDLPQYHASHGYGL